jgi:hypothetical protein
MNRDSIQREEQLARYSLSLKKICDTRVSAFDRRLAEFEESCDPDAFECGGGWDGWLRAAEVSGGVSAISYTVFDLPV